MTPAKKSDQVAGEVTGRISFVGLCSFFNVKNERGVTTDPSVVFAKTHDHQEHDQHNEYKDEMTKHIAFLAYDASVVDVDDSTGFQDVDQDLYYKYLEIEGNEIVLGPDTRRKAKKKRKILVAPSFAAVANAYSYWSKRLRNNWKPDHVPPKHKRPSKSAVAAYMRFDHGTLSGDRFSKFRYEFRFPNKKCTVKDRFAQEVCYDDFDLFGRAIVLHLKDLDTGETVRQLTFTPADDAQIAKARALATEGQAISTVKQVRLWIGNNTRDDIRRAIEREDPEGAPKPADHFKALHEAYKMKSGPIPYPVIEYTIAIGDSTGYCGPASGGP